MREHDRDGLINEQDHGTLSDEIPWKENSWVSTKELSNEVIGF
jgi:hypothetical protein